MGLGETNSNGGPAQGKDGQDNGAGENPNGGGQNNGDNDGSNNNNNDGSQENDANNTGGEHDGNGDENETEEEPIKLFVGQVRNETGRTTNYRELPSFRYSPP